MPPLLSIHKTPSITSLKKQHPYQTITMKFPYTPSMIITLFSLLCISLVSAEPFDLTKGSKPNKKDLAYEHWNLGPTGLRGWFHRENNRSTSSAKSRQILITEVAAGSPSEKIFQVGDVILGASGDGKTPSLFTSDARKSFGYAIGEAEARKPAILNIIQWRNGKKSIVSLSLRTLGRYSKTAPYDCPKSKAILEQGIDHLMTADPQRGFGFNSLALLAANDPQNPKNAVRQAKAKEVAHSLILSPEEIATYTSGKILTTSKITWSLGHRLLTLAEYYSKTKDKAVLPTLQAMAIQYANGQSMFGTSGHQLSKMGKDGSINGPYGVGYGTINNANLPAWLGLTIADKAGVTASEIKPAVERARRFYSSYVNQGSIGYGEHAPHFKSHSSNGKNGLAALTFSILDNETKARNFFGMMSAASSTEREIGHCGPYFNFTWAPLGANTLGGHALAQYFGELSWMYDLSRRWDGSFSYDAYEKSKNGSSTYGHVGFSMASSTLLTYAAPLKQLHITGKGLKRENWIDAKMLPEITKASKYKSDNQPVDELLNDLSSWSPFVRFRASNGFRKYKLSTEEVATELNKMLNNPKDLYQKYGAVTALKALNWHSKSADSLVPLLTDKDHVVRTLAAQGEFHEKHLNALLKATASTWRPVLPIAEHDPVNFAHYYLCLKLFYFGGNYGSPGLLAKHDLVGIDRELLYPAIRAAANSHIGLSRSAVGSIYDKLSEQDFKALSGAIVSSVADAAPADKMFSSGVRSNGLQVLHKFGYEEGITLAKQLKEEQPKIAFQALNKYGAEINTSSSKDDIIHFLEYYSNAGKYTKQAQEVLTKVTSDTNPTRPKTLKTLNTLEELTATPAKLKASVGKTTLKASYDHHLQAAPIFTWKKIHGAGNVTFSPNGNAKASSTTVSFDGKPGKYLFELSYSDANGLTTLTEQVAVTLTDSSGKLPHNAPPVVKNSTLKTTSGSPLTLKLPASDPENYELGINIKEAPKNGIFTKSADQWTYTADVGFTGKDLIHFQATDSEGQSQTGTITFEVGSSINVPVALYEPFAYSQKMLDKASSTHEIGFAEPWVGHPLSNLITKSHTFGKLPTIGGSIFPSQDAHKWVGSRRIHPDALKGNGLLGDGQTLWMSAVVGTDVIWQKSMNLWLANQSLKGESSHRFKEETPDLKFEGVGLYFSARYEAAAISSDSKAQEAKAKSTPMTLGVPLKQDRLVVIKCTWGAEEDIIEVFRPEDNLRLPAQPVSTIKTKVDQSLFDTLTLRRSGKIRIDEIRMGNSYQSVLQGNTPQE